MICPDCGKTMKLVANKDEGRIKRWRCTCGAYVDLLLSVKHPKWLEEYGEEEK